MITIDEVYDTLCKERSNFPSLESFHECLSQYVMAILTSPSGIIQSIRYCQKGIWFATWDGGTPMTFVDGQWIYREREDGMVYTHIPLRDLDVITQYIKENFTDPV